MAIKFFEKPVNAVLFGKLKDFEMFKRETCSKDIYMKIPEIYVQTMDGSFPKNSLLIYGDSYRYFYVCYDSNVFPVKSEIQIYE